MRPYIDNIGYGDCQGVDKGGSKLITTTERFFQCVLPFVIALSEVLISSNICIITNHILVGILANGR